MRKLIFLIILSVGSLWASTSLDQRQDRRQDESYSQQESMQRQEQDSISNTRQDTKGQEGSVNKEIRNTIGTVRSATQSVQRSIDNKIQLTLNPIPILFEILAQNPNIQHLFFVTNQEIGTDTYYNGNPRYIDNLKKNWQEAQRSNRGVLSPEQTKNIEVYLNDYIYLSELLKQVVYKLQNYSLNLGNIYPVAQQLMAQVSRDMYVQPIKLKQCNYADTGMHDIYNCDRTWSFQLTGDIPQIAKFGKVIFAKDHIDGIQAQLQVSAGETTSESFSNALNMSEDYVLANALRQYVSTLEQKGETQTANKIKQAVTQKAFTTGLSQTHSSAIQAINSGNPLAVLKVFQ